MVKSLRNYALSSTRSDLIAIMVFYWDIQPAFISCKPTSSHLVNRCWIPSWTCSVIVSIPDTWAILKPFWTLFCRCKCASIGSMWRWREDDLFDHKSLRSYHMVRARFDSIGWNGLVKIRQGGQAGSIRSAQSWPRYHEKEEQDSFTGVKNIRQPLTKASECSEFMIKFKIILITSKFFFQKTHFYTILFLLSASDKDNSCNYASLQTKTIKQRDK